MTNRYHFGQYIQLKTLYYTNTINYNLSASGADGNSANGLTGGNGGAGGKVGGGGIAGGAGKGQSAFGIGGNGSTSQNGGNGYITLAYNGVTITFN